MRKHRSYWMSLGWRRSALACLPVVLASPVLGGEAERGAYLLSLAPVENPAPAMVGPGEPAPAPYFTVRMPG